jgi:hypothetical protein
VERGLHRRNGATLRRFRTCDDRAWRADPPPKFEIASMPVVAVALVAAVTARSL